MEDQVIKMCQFELFLSNQNILEILRTNLGWETHFSDQQ